MSTSNKLKDCSGQLCMYVKVKPVLQYRLHSFVNFKSYKSHDTRRLEYKNKIVFFFAIIHNYNDDEEEDTTVMVRHLVI